MNCRGIFFEYQADKLFAILCTWFLIWLMVLEREAMQEQMS